VQAIPLPTLNSTRLQLLTSRYLKCVRRSNNAAFGVDAESVPTAYINYQRVGFGLMWAVGCGAGG